MKKALPILIVELIVSIAAAFAFNEGFMNYNFFTTLGLANLIIGLLSFLVGLIVYFVNKEQGKPILLSSGIILFLGCLTCSIFPFQLN